MFFRLLFFLLLCPAEIEESRDITEWGLKAEVQGLFYYRGHVVVSVLREATTEENVGFFCGEGAVFVGQTVILVVIDGIVLFHA